MSLIKQRTQTETMEEDRSNYHTVVGSRKGSTYYVLNDYAYLVRRKSPGVLYLTCVNRSCGARAKIPEDDDHLYVSSEHDHGPMTEFLAKVKALNLMKERAENSPEVSFASIFREVCAEMPQATEDLLLDTVRSTLSKQKRQRKQYDDEEWKPQMSEQEDPGDLEEQHSSSSFFQFKEELTESPQDEIDEHHNIASKSDETLSHFQVQASEAFRNMEAEEQDNDYYDESLDPLSVEDDSSQLQSNSGKNFEIMTGHTRGSVLYKYNNYAYLKNNCRDGRIYLACAKHLNKASTSPCRARAKIENDRLVPLGLPHNHNNVKDILERVEAYNEMKHRAETTSESLRSIYASVCAKRPEATATISYDTFWSAVCKRRKKNQNSEQREFGDGRISRESVDVCPTESNEKTSQVEDNSSDTVEIPGTLNQTFESPENTRTLQEERVEVLDAFEDSDHSVNPSQDNVLVSIREFFESETFADVNLYATMVENNGNLSLIGPFKAHRLILSAVSPFMKNVLEQTSTTEHVCTEIVLDGIEGESLQHFLRVVYGTSDSVRPDLFEEVSQLLLSDIPSSSFVMKKDFIQGDTRIGAPMETEDSDINEDTDDEAYEPLAHYSSDFDTPSDTEPTQEDLQETQPTDPNGSIAYACKLCKQSIVGVSNYKRHMRVDHKAGKMWHCCPDCPRTSRWKQGIDLHYKIVHLKQRPFCCPTCSMSFKCPKALRRHRLKIHKERHIPKERPPKAPNLCCNKVHPPAQRKTCCLCSKLCSKLTAVQQHVQSKHFDRKHICEHCGRRFTTPEEFHKHNLKRLKAGKNLQCSQCDQIFCYVKSLNAHVRSAHKDTTAATNEDPPEEFTPPPQEDIAYVCTMCKQSIVGRSNYKRHMEEDHKAGKSWYCCPSCPRTARYYPTIDLHYRVVHLKERPFPCPTCSMTFKQDKSLRIHRHKVHRERFVPKERGPKVPNSCCGKIHPPAERTTCCLCSRRFTQWANVQNHVQFAHFNVKHMCEQCGKQFTSADCVRKHIIRKHEGEKNPLKCLQCDRKFGELKTLNAHVRYVHEGKCVLCTDCGKKFQNKQQLRVHVDTVHLKLKKLKCHYCDKMFIANSGRFRHEMTEHKMEKKFKCDQCPMAFAYIRTLKAHILENHKSDAERFACWECDKVYSDRRGRDIHFRAVHEGERPIVSCGKCGQKLDKLKREYKIHMKKHRDEEAEVRGEAEARRRS